MGNNNLAFVGAFGKRAGGKLGKIFWPRQILCQMPKSTSIFGFCKVFGASDPPNEKFANKKILQGKANTHLLLWFFRLHQTDLCLLKNNGLAHLDDLKSTAIATNGPNSLNIKLKHLWSSFVVFN